MLMSKSDYNPSIGLVKPDPERWIPRKQRSYAKRGRRGRNKFVGAQGSGMGGSKDDMKLDAAARAAQGASGRPGGGGCRHGLQPTAAAAAAAIAHAAAPVVVVIVRQRDAGDGVQM